MTGPPFGSKIPRLDVESQNGHQCDYLIVKHLHEAVDKARRTEHRVLLRQADTRLTGTKYLRLRRPGDLRPEQRRQMRQLVGSDLKVARAWTLKERFRQFWEYTYRGLVQTFFARNST